MKKKIIFEGEPPVDYKDDFCDVLLEVDGGIPPKIYL